jgi:hypothetical protein
MARWTRAVGRRSTTLGLGSAAATGVERRLGSAFLGLGAAAVGLGCTPVGLGAAAARTLGWMDRWAVGLGAAGSRGLLWLGRLGGRRGRLDPAAV